MFYNVVSDWIWSRQSQGFEADSRCPEVVTANQRACEFRVRDWVESQGTVITRWLGKNKLSYNYDIDVYLYCSSDDVIVEWSEVIGREWGHNDVEVMS